MPNAKTECTCQICGTVFLARADAKTCSNACRLRLSRGAKAMYSGVSEAVEAELQSLGALDTVVGMQAMALAQFIDGKFAVATGVASMSKELSRLMDEVRLMSASNVSPLDSLLEDEDDLSDY